MSLILELGKKEKTSSGYISTATPVLEKCIEESLLTTSPIKPDNASQRIVFKGVMNLG